MDLSSKSLVVVNRRIGFTDFLNGEIVENEISDLASELYCKLTGCCNSNFGFISCSDYLKLNNESKISVGVGIGINSDNNIYIDNISQTIRYILPHEDDVQYRGNDILPVNNPDNYLVGQNSMELKLEKTLTLNIFQINLYGIFNIAINTTGINRSELVLNQNLYHKWYVTNNLDDPENPNSGTAFIYYGVKSKKRNFFESKSFSIPLSVTYPVFYLGNGKEVILKLLGGTNILLPEKIELEYEKGWYRFGEYEVQNDGNGTIGEIKEVNWFAGFEAEGRIGDLLKLNFQLAYVHSEYSGNFSFPLSFHLKNNSTTLIRLNILRTIQ